MKNVFFSPFVGKNYEHKGFNGLKLLILGESHYCGEDCESCGDISNNECADFTKTVIHGFINYKRGNEDHADWMRTFTRFTNVLLNDKVDNETLIDFWDSVVFYNYVQSSTNGPRISPTSLQFEKSKNAFIEVLEVYKPDLILVWGERLWYNLPDTGKWGEEDILDNGKFYYYKVGDKETPAYKIYHPSTQYFNYEYSKYLKEAMRLASK